MNNQISAKGDKILFLMDFHATDDSGRIPTASNAVLRLDKSDVMEIVDLATLVHEKDLHVVQKASSAATWIELGRSDAGILLDQIENKFVERDGDPIGELNEEFGARLLAEIDKPGGSTMVADVKMPKLVVTADEVSWIAFPRRALAPYQTFEIKIADLCRRFDVDLPAHIETSLGADAMRV